MNNNIIFSDKDIKLMLKTIKAQQRMIISYRMGSSKIPEWVLNALDKAEKKGWLE